MESAEPPESEEEVRPSEEDWRPLESEDAVSVLVPVLVSALVPLSALLELEVESEGLLAVVAASDSIVPTRANTPAAAASETAAATAAVRRIPLRTAAAAPRSRSLTVMAVPLRRT
ncbi:hypothetical protein [Streptomyces sp. AK08-02]|uniref:hypothetical protein n=1 Tax=Streptomyces sp. AK08-02 TaxID=3028654 RepID=UPI0029A60EF1|nr:hypothetical protein [Streptomyces sp. AK08-02]MDX3750051.1 hypothetical protein [Streptomyces sp. AK08-02]